VLATRIYIVVTCNGCSASYRKNH